MWQCGHQRLDLRRTTDDLTMDVPDGQDALLPEESPLHPHDPYFRLLVW